MISADLVGLPSPTPYAFSGVKSINTGINFAIGGSGVTYAYGLPTLANQVDNFELVLKTGVYSPSFLASSVSLVSNVGNDYGAVPYPTKDLVLVIEEVVEGLTLSLQRLHDFGLRDILVANLPPTNCVPGQTLSSNYTACLASSEPLIALHNYLLEGAVAKLNKLPNANFLILDEHLAFEHIRNHSSVYGIEETFAPCCRPLAPENSCGDVDHQGRPLYTLCEDPTLYTFWDNVHPTQSTWNHAVELFKNKEGFVLGAPTLEEWLCENSLRPKVVPTPTPSGSPVTLPTLPGAVQELEKAYEALIEDPNYSEAIGLLQAIDLNEYLANYPKQKVTVFLPINGAFFSLPLSTIARIYGENDMMMPLISFHVVKGYYSASQLSSADRNYTTLSYLQLQVTNKPSEILVGPEAAKVVRPDLYNVAGEVVIHGIDKLLFPPRW